MWRTASVFVILVLFVSVNAQSGRSCRTPNGESATCVSIYNCRNLLGVVQSRDSIQLKFLRESQCGYESDPLVCCGRETNYVSTQSATERRPVTSGGTGGAVPRKNSAIPDRATCGFQESDNIYNGEDTALDEFPWMVLLQYRNASGHLKWSCGGTLISPRYVLTAAHCVTGDILRVVGRLVNVRLGDWNTDTAVDCTNSKARIRYCNQPIDVGVEGAQHHPDYVSTDANRYGDLALVRLERKVSFNNFIRPICLPLPNQPSSTGKKLVVAGWGRTERLSRSPIKQKLKLAIAEKSECSRTFSTAAITLINSQICAGGEAGKDSCTGDSGGPLMGTTSNDSSQWYIEGIVSFGARCGTEGWPGVYTKVSSYLNWIYDNVRN